MPMLPFFHLQSPLPQLRDEARGQDGPEAYLPGFIGEEGGWDESFWEENR